VFAQLRYTLRDLRRSRSFSVVAILTLGIAISANTAIYSVTNAALFKSLPFANPDQLVVLWERHPIIGKQEVAQPDFRDWQQQSHSYSQLAAYTTQGEHVPLLTGIGEPQPLQAVAVTPNLTTTLGIQPVLGRAFRDDEDRPGHNHVAMLSHKLWIARFAADRDVLGRSIILDGETYRIVAVLPAESAIPAWADIWVPLERPDSYLPSLRAAHNLEVIGRLKPNIALAQADAEVRSIAARLSSEYPVTNGPTGAYAVSFRENFVGYLKKPLLLLQGGAALVLSICCANLAILALVRGRRRQGDTEIRVALGASPRQLFSASLTEVLVIAAAGGLLGVPLARAIVGALEPRIIAVLPLSNPVSFDLRVFSFVLCCSIAGALLFGLLPCVRILRAASVREGSRHVMSHRNSLGHSMIAVQTALAMVVLAGTVLLAESFRQILQVQPGFQTTHLIAARLSIPGTKYRTEESVEEYFKRLMAKMSAQAQIRGAAAVDPALLVRGGGRFWIDGRPDPPPNQFPVAQFRNVTPSYFDTVGLRLLGGRLFEHEGESKPVVVVNRAFERRFFGQASAVGHSVLQGLIRPPRRKISIVGVVSDARDLGLIVAPEPTIYWLGPSRDATLLVRTVGDANKTIEDTLRSVDSEVWSSPLESMDTLFSTTLVNRRFVLELIALFALASCLLAALGTYGVVANAVGERTREIGLRLAVGASPAEVVTIFVRRNLVAVACGLAIGIPAAAGAASLMRGALFGVRPEDPRIYLGVAVAMITIALAASWVPARRAAKVDPLSALREQ